MAENLDHIKAILHEALEKETEAERKAYLDKACGADANLRAEVESLLRSHDDAGDFLDSPPFGTSVTLNGPPISEVPGTVIGRYKLLEHIGEGGFGVVYMADQTQPIHRRVALKIIKLGMDTKEVIARFEAERQALAMMDHPNIAKVFDAGATDTGRPFFVMELVKGIPITKYCDKNNLDTQHRLELFIDVCKAVQHAHQKGIIHRDLKPTNVMITLHDGKPVPKVIDFGIAKATGQRLTEKTLFTRYAQMIGTPEYMSPEQAEFSGLDVDTRSDIYSLGVLLYELLTGATPFDGEKLREAGYAEMQRIIQEDDPDKPSTRLSAMGEALTDVAKHRRVAPETLRKLVRGDLDWIVMKSLEKDRTRRYETASGLAEDIRRHLEHEPVLARGPGAAYRVERFLRRHRSQMAAAAALTVTAAAVAVVLSMWKRDRLQLAEAEGFKHRGILSQASEQHARAARDAAMETIRPILHSKHVGPEAQLLRATILVDNRRFDEAVTVLEDLLNKQPEIAGAAHSLLARIHWEGESPDAETLKEIEEHRQQAETLLPETAEAYFLRAMTAVTVKEQLAALDEALQLDLSHYASRRLRAFTYYASRKYEKMKDDAMVMVTTRPRDPLGYSLHAIAWGELGHYPEAIVDYDVAISLMPPEDPQYADISIQRCEVFLKMGDYEGLIAEARQCLGFLPDTPALQYQIFCALTALGEYDQAITLFRQIVAPGHEARRRFREWCAKYVFDTLEAGRSWHPDDDQPVAAAFLPMVEAEETYHHVSAQGHRLTKDGFSAAWSPDGARLAFSLGVQGSSGVATYDPATKETDLLIVPGKDPRWSPDGEYIAFVRDRQNLRLEELATAEPGQAQPPVTDEEVWVMRSDGTEPRRLAQGSWPSWGSDSEHIYYLSRRDYTLRSSSLIEQDGEPKKIMKCSKYLPTVSPDNQRVSFFHAGGLRIKDLASQEHVAKCPMPSMTWGVTAWSPTGHEVCLGGGTAQREKAGLWVYDLRSSDFSKVLDAPITTTCWSPVATELTFCLGPPYDEIWVARLDPNVPTVEAFGPGQTLDEHVREIIAFYSRRIDADPQDAYAYFSRARYYEYLNKHGKAYTDMQWWSAALSGRTPADAPLSTLHVLRRVINMPFDCQLVFSAERPVNTNSTISVALRQKGRYEMKLFEIPMFVTPLLGLCLLSGLDTPPAYADFTFGTPTNLGPAINSPKHDGDQCVSLDGSSLSFTRWEFGWSGHSRWVAGRAEGDNLWDDPVLLGTWEDDPGAIRTAILESTGGALGWGTADLLEYYFFADLPGGYGGTDMWVSKRETVEADFSPPENLGPLVNTSSDEFQCMISLDGLTLCYAPRRPDGYGGQDIWIATRATRSDPWNAPTNLGPNVNSPSTDYNPHLSADGLLLLFVSDRPGGLGDLDIYMTRRASPSDLWEQAVNLGPMVNTSAHDNFPFISPDGSTLYFASWGRGGYGGLDIYQAPITRVVDFNGDGKASGLEVRTLTELWGTDDSLCDIGPMPWGDGMVDVNDVKVLAQYIDEPVVDGTLVAHWALDETEGATAYDSVRDRDGTVIGTCAWQPIDGQVNGALALDGGTCVVADRVLNPADGPFSVLAWINGGAPGEVIVSQVEGTNWLAIDTLEGTLATELVPPTRRVPVPPLVSTAPITDGVWHRVAFVWDGMRRSLYVDDVLVAQDEQDSLAACPGGLNLGCGADLSPGTFFSGLIDDVRIYNRAVRP